ncbi:MAG: hypothetical protein ABF379_08340, partial [Akkermansiaceae bacterium]
FHPPLDTMNFLLCFMVFPVGSCEVMVVHLELMDCFWVLGGDRVFRWVSYLVSFSLKVER